ncbi:hypothetical protein ACGK9U_14295 [Mariniflexile sp. HNIBRBA6329]|uniref:hypothetical protein n=1 Tax=Mariniflexile sp. HNIBRBA6329 TaxID=3373088 RepID=UPI0037454596
MHTSSTHVEVEDLCGLLFFGLDTGNYIKGQVLFVDVGIIANFGYMAGENN